MDRAHMEPGVASQRWHAEQFAMACLFAAALALLVGACGSPPSGTGGITSPTTVDIYPLDATSDNPARLFIAVTGVGAERTYLPLAFDTGSAGITLNALSIFPASVVTPDGFIFPQGSTEITYDGITVTADQGSRVYGTRTGGRTEIGNLGFAPVTFGDDARTLTTRMMPIFFFYAQRFNNSGATAPPQQQQGWFGVYDAPNLVHNVDSPPSSLRYPECDPGVITSCYVVSVLKYLDYANGVDAGFLLRPSPLESCDISVEGNCAPASILTIGITPSFQTGFDAIPLNCTSPAPGYSGPAQMEGYSVCSPAIPDTLISAIGPPIGSYSGPVTFDTGTPYIALSVPSGATFPSSISEGTELDITMSNGFLYALTAGPTTGSISISASSDAASIVGLPYFTTNSFFIDFSDSLEGWR